MIKTAARYVPTDTLIRHIEARDRLLAGLGKEAGVGDAILGFGKKVITAPKNMASWVVKKGPQAMREGMIGDAGSAGRRVLHPIAGLQKGWASMSGTASRAEKLKGMRETLGKLRAEATAASAAKVPARANKATRAKMREAVKKQQEVVKKQREAIKEFEANTAHLAPGMSKGWGAAFKAGPKGVAEELSRAGWTGKGQYTKYLPLSQKALMTGFAASEVPGIVNAPAATRTGEGGALERAGGMLGGTAGWIASSGRIGLLPAAALWMAAQKAGTTVGRIADRMRAGASLGEAATAPSPQEAREQLAKIYQTYGG